MPEFVFLAHRVPNPPDRGDKIRSHNLLKTLCRLGEVHLVCFADDAADLAHAEALRPMLASLYVEQRRVSKPAAAARAMLSGRPMLLALFDSAAMRAHAASLIAARPIDALLAFSVQMAQFVPADLGGARFVMDFVDVDSAKFAAYAEEARGPMRMIYAREARLLAAFEAETAARAERCLLVSAAEAALFLQRLGGAPGRVATLGNGVDTAFFDPDESRAMIAGRGGPLIVFTGQMDYRPNIEAVSAFALETLPLIRESRADTHFAIVGRNPPSHVARLAENPGVEVTGAVPDIRAWLAAADVVVAPLRTARGIQNKVLEAMAMARPVVASPAAFEGIDAVPGRDLIVAEGPRAEADAVLALLDDRIASSALGEAARARVIARYGWDAALAPLAEILGIGHRAPALAGAAA